MELNREQIIKALECCASSSLEDCDNCPIDKQKKDNCECGRYLAIQALALIRELTEEKERLKLDVEECGAELSRYTENIVQMAKQDRADTVRKMQERLNAERGYDYEWHYNSWWGETIDQIAKELLEKEGDDA